jgi:hypothetical protein
MTKKVVDVIFFYAIDMSSIWRNGMDCEVTLDIVDDVRWVVDIADAWSWSRAEV